MTQEVTTEGSSGLGHAARIRLAWSLGASFFWVLCVWGFWEKGVFAFGMNVAVYLALVFGLFLWELRRHAIRIQDQLFWMIPMGMIIASFALYDNPFLKGFSIILLPVLFAFFYTYSFLKERERVFWDAGFLAKMFERCAGMLGSLGSAVSMHVRLVAFPTKHGGVVKRVVLGLALLLVISTVVIIPILSSADKAFADSMQGFVVWMRTFLSASILHKLAVGVVFSCITLGALLGWARLFSHEGHAGERKQLDAIVTGIVLGGVLLLYLLFLGLQVQNLWIDRLPMSFEEVEQLVKGGFWQLLFLSVINIGFYLFTYRKTAPFVQKILGAFTVASLFLLVSAAHRMVLYILFYGFSYEKFFASYTVAFCAILFVWMIARLFIKARADILKFVAYLFLWMFAVATILPVERFILVTNVGLAKQEGTQIRLYELTMLSPDVLGLVEEYQQSGQLQERADVYDRENNTEAMSAEDSEAGWVEWIARQQEMLEDKAWYEKNVSNVLYEYGRGR